MLRERLTMEFLHQHTVDEDYGAVRDCCHFSWIARGKENHPPRLSKASHDTMHFSLGGHIDATRRIVEHKQRWRRLDPLGEDDLLLVTARQSADGLQYRFPDDTKLPAALYRGIRQALPS